MNSPKPKPIVNVDHTVSLGEYVPEIRVGYSGRDVYLSVSDSPIGVSLVFNSAHQPMCRQLQREIAKTDSTTGFAKMTTALDDLRQRVKAHMEQTTGITLSDDQLDAAVGSLLNRVLLSKTATETAMDSEPQIFAVDVLSPVAAAA